jgi:UDP-N-acetyl-D-glucosamine dehydrogenase
MATVEAGWRVLGIDNSESKVAQINSGASPIEDVSDSQLRKMIESGKYRASTDFSVASSASTVIICVPTPLDEKREPDLSMLRNALEKLGSHIANETLIISESTSYPGTLRQIIAPTINSLKPIESVTLYFACAPERINPGDKIWNLRNTPRVIAAMDSESQTKVIDFYSSICETPILVSTPEIAEAAKLLENTYRLVNIALVNEFAQICSINGISVNEVITAASSKPYGFMPFRPGVGVGGHCIPVDPLYLTWWARKSGSHAQVVELAASINSSMPEYISERALGMVRPETSNPKVLILGFAYKSGISDVRETPMSALRDHLLEKGAQVAWHDPLVPIWEGTQPVELDWECDVAILATAQFGINIDVLIRNGTPILDCTNSMKNTAGVTFI